jgi:Leucine-rich repeat (LRR) protein
MCGYNKKNINNNIKYLCCMNEEIEKLENLPNNLEVLICEGNKIKSLNKLPKSLKVLMCRDNEIEELILPKGLRYLSCENNKIKKLKLSPYIEELYCDDEYINYENIPNMIKILEIETKENEIKSKLPYGLEEIKGGITKIESTMLPKSIKIIDKE